MILFVLARFVRGSFLGTGPRLSERDNEPRYDSLQWYCEIIGVDFDEAINYKIRRSLFMHNPELPGDPFSALLHSLCLFGVR